MFSTKIYTNKEEKIGGEKALNHLADKNLASPKYLTRWTSTLLTEIKNDTKAFW